MSDDRIVEYLRSRARVEVPPDTVRSVMAAVDLAPSGRPWVAVPLARSLAAVAAAAAVVVGLAVVGGTRTGPGPVPDCSADPHGLLQYAIDRLETVDGYRWTEEEQMWGFDPSVPPSAEDPQYAWSGYTAEGAYLAPDRMHVVVTDADERDRLGGFLGAREVIHIDGRTYAADPGVRDEAGEELDFEWQQLPADIDPNRLRAFFPSVGSLAPESLDPADLSWELPGEGGCVIVREVRGSPPPSGAADMPRVIYAARVDAEGRLVAGLSEGRRPAATDEERFGDTRRRFSVAYETPDAAEFAVPDGPIYTDAPSPSAAAVEPSASPTASPPPSRISVLESEEADALFSRADTCTNGRLGYTATFPDDWYTNTAVGDVPACSWFTPDLFEVEAPGQTPDEVWITVGAIDGTFGYTSATPVTLSEDVVVDGHAGHRAEFNPRFADDAGHRSYHYVIPFGNGARTLVAATDVEMADDYELAKAILDRVMASLDFRDVPAIPTEPTGPLIDGSPVTAEDDDGTFRLTVTADQDRYRAGQVIDVEAALTYLGPSDTVVGRGSSHSLIGFGVESEEMPLYIGPAFTTDCAQHDFVRGVAVTFPFGKSGSGDDGTPYAAFYRSYFASPELRLPAGTWTIGAGGSVYVGDCGDELHEFSASVTVVVEP